MRILYVTNARLGWPYAPASRARGLAAALARCGIDVHLVGIEPMPARTPVGVQLDALPLPSVRKWGAVVWHAALASRLAALPGRRFHVLLLREAPYTVEPALWATVWGVPWVLEVNGRVPGFGPIGSARPFYRWNYRRASRIVTLTEPLAAYLERTFHVPRARIRVVPNAADTDLFRPIPRAEARRWAGVPQDAFVVVYMGSYDPQQGVEIVLPLCRTVRREIPEVLFLMTGAGPARDRLAVQVERAGLGTHFRFTGHVPEDRIAHHIAAADAAFSPVDPREAWRTEATFPQKVVEYLACGVPVLAMGHSEAQRSILVEGRCGALVPADQHAVFVLARALVEWRRDVGLRDAMGRRGAALVRGRFSYDAIARRFEEIFREL